MDVKLVSVMAMNKAEIRERILNWRDRLTMEEINSVSETVCTTLLSMEAYRKASTLMGYAAFRNEVSLRKLVEQAWADGKSVLFPKVNRQRGELEAYYIRSYADLRPGVWGILEPDEHRRRRQGEQPIDIIYMPGLAFDRGGRRLGYGGGYYDKFMAGMRCPLPERIAVAHSGQIIDKVPYEAHDIPVDCIVTEKEIISPSNLRF
jgi:5-formyltetrahydrofolate cyclo-ligase